MAKRNIEINEQFAKALEVMDGSAKNVFVTGKAGTGKSTLLEYFRSVTRKKIVVLAPTGVAAVNVRGQTIHSFMGFKPDITLQKVKKAKGKRARIFKELDAVVIDEISMVRSDLLDCADKFLRLNGPDLSKPFGGVQMIFIGDLYQLPPVVTSREREIFAGHYASPYFFSAHSFEDFQMEFIELEKIYRQKDDSFIAILNAIRNASITDEMLLALNSRVASSFRKQPGGLSVHLTTTNQMAAEVNLCRLNELKAKILTYRARITGDFEKNYYPADDELQLAVGSQVMLLNNDAKGQWVNGSVGVITDIRAGRNGECDVIRVRLEDGDTVEVAPFTWDLFHYCYNEATASIDTEEVGSFAQYPLKLAWAITIHKSQGKTFERVVVDMGRGAFACGQTYVALSRCTTLEGLMLARPIRKSDIRMDWNISRFLTKYQYSLSERDMPIDEKIALIEQAIGSGGLLDIVYLKASDEKTRRLIKPRKVGPMEYQGKPFIGVDAYCMKRKDGRVFRVDRMLEIKPLNR